MPKQNPYLINNNKSVEEVREIPTYQPKYTYEEAARLKEQFIAEQKEEIKKYQIKTSPLSPEARSKVIRKWGSDYVSEDRESYGPGNEQSTTAAVVAGTVVGGVVIVATGGAATPLVVAGARAAEGAYRTYHAQTHLETRHLALGLGLGVGALALTNGSRNSQNSSTSSSSTSFTLEKKTIWSWWCNGLSGEEREILLEHGYSDRSGCFSLEELKSTSERMFAEKAPGKPTEKDGFKPNKNQGDKLVKNPNGKGKGWLDKNDEVWVPTGKGGDNPEGRPHGGPHWDVQNPRTGGHRNVYPGGGVR